MQASTYLARLIGPVLAILGLGMLFNAASYVALVDEFMRNPALLYFASALGLLAGIAVVLAHNVWTADWRVIITLLGWISIVDSASWILATDLVRRFWSPLVLTSAFAYAAGVLVLLLGAVLCYYGFRPAPQSPR
jgi:hypothetical protein